MRTCRDLSNYTLRRANSSLREFLTGCVEATPRKSKHSRYLCSISTKCSCFRITIFACASNAFLRRRVSPPKWATYRSSSSICHTVIENLNIKTKKVNELREWFGLYYYFCRLLKSFCFSNVPVFINESTCDVSCLYFFCELSDDYIFFFQETFQLCQTLEVPLRLKKHKLSLEEYEFW